MKQTYVFAADERYASKLMVSITSLIESQRKFTNDNVEVYVLSNGIGESSIRLLKKISDSYRNFEIIVYDIANLNDLLPDNIYIGNLSIAAYSRLFIPKLFENKHRVLYLDTDILIDDNLEFLFEMDLKKNYIAGVQAVLEKGRQGFAVNSGVTLWNIPECKKVNLFQKFMDFLEKNGDKVEFHDQTVINQVASGKMLKLPLKYNTTTPILLYSYQRFINMFNLSSFYSEKEYNDASNNPAIIHLTAWTTGRPWQRGNIHPYSSLYEKYANMINVNVIDENAFYNKKVNFIRDRFYKLAPIKIVKMYRKGR
ncbi:glycosyltransferase family 8 protein [Enterococcus sp. S86.2]|uniref:glycosyltransferase family 8 protein n=1 Tax=Enterococcus sp. S86.2 TaxID=3031299 RepID=UPI0026E94E5E|nr:glycosyltransferase family 8 protein [Enterococcus sp. S86.2]